jgi:hypothetical protein
MCRNLRIAALITLMACRKPDTDEPPLPDPRDNFIGAYAGLWSDRLDTAASSYMDTFYVTAAGADSIRIINEAFHPIYISAAPFQLSARFLFNGSGTYYWELPSNYETTYSFFSQDGDSLFYVSRFQSPMSPSSWNGSFRGQKL